MRIDARNLLERLGRTDFAYREFEDRFNELELWPILEALLKDPRLQALDKADAAPAETDAPEAQEQQPERTGETLSSLFTRYERGEGPAGAAPDRRGAQPQDVRAMLRQLSDLGSRGEI